MQQRELLIDGDILLWRFGCANQKEFKWDGDDEPKKVVTLEEARGDLDSFIADLTVHTECPEFTICFSSHTNFRYRVLPTYKANRKKLPKPILYDDLKKFMYENYTCLSMPDLEGDDLMGILSTSNPDDYIIASIDKDMKQIPGRHYHWGNGRLTYIPESAADYWFFTQVLTGDSCDGYRGIPGVGPKKAEKILKEAFHKGEYYWPVVVAAYAKHGLDEADALIQARVARILRAGDYDFSKNEVTLWVPYLTKE